MLITLPALVAVLLVGCTTLNTYWVHTYEPVVHTNTIYVDRPCGHTDWAGCANRATGVIQISRRLTETQSWCVLNHEKKHLAGYTHPGERGILAYDCGNGEIL